MKKGTFNIRMTTGAVETVSGYLTGNLGINWNEITDQWVVSQLRTGLKICDFALLRQAKDFVGRVDITFPWDKITLENQVEYSAKVREIYEIVLTEG